MIDAVATIEAVRPYVEDALREIDLVSDNIYQAALEEVEAQYPDLCDQSGPHVVTALYILGDNDLRDGIAKVRERERRIGRMEGYLIAKLEDKLDQGGRRIDQDLFPHLLDH